MSERLCSLARSGGQGHGDVILLGRAIEEEIAIGIEFGAASADLRLGRQAARSPIRCHETQHEGDRNLEVGVPHGGSG